MKAGSLVAPFGPSATTVTTKSPDSGEAKVPSALMVAVDPGGATAIDQLRASPAGTVCASNSTL
jgi:hypothetical protein